MTMTKVPVKINGILFESIAEAARHYECSHSNIVSMLERGSFKNLGIGQGKINCVVVEYNGKRYNSVTEFAKENNIRIEVTKQRMSVRRRHGYDTFMSDIGEVKIIGKLKDLRHENL